MENYQIIDVIGEGSFGKVYKARKKYSGQIVAIKFIPKRGKMDKELKNIRREIDIIRSIRHPYIIEMLEWFETAGELVMVTDYAEGELFRILQDDKVLPAETVQKIATQLVIALHYLHSRRVLHRDMKPQNILLTEHGIKLCDFGFARMMSLETLVLTSIKGTPLYMAPEIIDEKPYDHTADLWALGCILYECFVGRPPFYAESIIKMVALVTKARIAWPSNMPPLMTDFLQGLLHKEPQKRLNWPHLLHHPFISPPLLPDLPYTCPEKSLAHKKRLVTLPDDLKFEEKGVLETACNP